MAISCDIYTDLSSATDRILWMVSGLFFQTWNIMESTPRITILYINFWIVGHIIQNWALRSCLWWRWEPLHYRGLVWYCFCCCCCLFVCFNNLHMLPFLLFRFNFLESEVIPEQATYLRALQEKESESRSINHREKTRRSMFWGWRLAFIKSSGDICSINWTKLLFPLWGKRASLQHHHMWSYWLTSSEDNQTDNPQLSNWTAPVWPASNRSNSWEFPWYLVGKESSCSAWDLGLILGREDPLEKEMTNNSSILAWKNPMDRGAWRAVVHGTQRVGHN